MAGLDCTDIENPVNDVQNIDPPNHNKHKSPKYHIKPALWRAYQG